MTMIKNYWGFTNWGYKLILLLVVPLAVALLGAWGFFTEGIIPMVVAVVVTFQVLPAVDMVSDYWLLGGFYAKGNSSLEFLQTSTKFKPIIRDVVVVDIIRRLAFYLGSFLVMYLICVNKDEATQMFIQHYYYMPVLNIFIALTAVFISRFFRTLNYVFSASMFGMGANGFFMMAAMELPANVLNVIIVGLALLSVVMCVVTVMFSLKKVRDSYYDK